MKNSFGIRFGKRHREEEEEITKSVKLPWISGLSLKLIKIYQSHSLYKDVFKSPTNNLDIWKQNGVYMVNCMWKEIRWRNITESCHETQTT